MTYSALKERIFDLREFRAGAAEEPTGFARMEEINRRIQAIEDPAERTAFEVLRMLQGRKGFAYWWEPHASGGMSEEDNEEIFEEMKAIIRRQGARAF